MKTLNRLENGFCVKCGGILIEIPGNNVPLCSKCKEDILRQVATMKAKKKKKRKG